jgi:hypothetical protein
MTKYTVLLIALSGFAQAQQGSIGGPVSGFVFDGGSQALRPIRGSAGAATFGDPIACAYPLTAAYVAPHQDSAFGVAAAGATGIATHYFTLNSSTLTEVSIAGLMTQPEHVVFSPSGTAAALYANGQAQLVTGLPGSPVLAGSLPLRQGAQSIHPTSLAVSDDGTYLLFAVGSSIQLASQSGGVRGVMTAGAGASVAFAPGSGYNAAVAARGTGAVLIQNVAGSAAQQTLAVDDGSFEVVAGLSFSTDGKHLFAASAAAQSVVTLDLSGNRADIACSFTPTELQPMGNLFLLTAFGTGPLWLADTGSSGPRVVFVPALTAAQ